MIVLIETNFLIVIYGNKTRAIYVLIQRELNKLE